MNSQTIDQITKTTMNIQELSIISLKYNSFISTIKSIPIKKKHFKKSLEPRLLEGYQRGITSAKQFRNTH